MKDNHSDKRETSDTLLACEVWSSYVFRMASNSRSSCLSLPSVGVTGMCHHTHQSLTLLLLLVTSMAGTTEPLSPLTGAETINNPLLRHTF